jgi:hypothetical protein
VTLAELLESKFRGDIRFRGEAYLKAERVQITRVTPNHVFGAVRDGVEYQTQLTREDAGLKMYCNCATGNQPEVACKHLWATILAVDERGFVSGTAKPGHIPPFAAEYSPVPIEDSEWEDDAPGDVFRPSRPRRSSTAVKLQPRLRAWEARLQDLRQMMRAAEPVAPAAGRETEIFYEIDPVESRQVGQLVLQTAQRQRRASGQWGKLKPLKLRPGKLDEIEHSDDRQILAFIMCARSHRRLPER